MSEIQELQKRLRREGSFAAASHRNSAVNTVARNYRSLQTPYGQSTSYFQDKYAGVSPYPTEDPEMNGHDSGSTRAPNAPHQRTQMERELINLSEAYQKLETSFLVEARKGELLQLRLQGASKTNEALEMRCSELQGIIDENRRAADRTERIVASLNARNRLLESENAHLQESLKDMLSSRHQPSQQHQHPQSRFSIALDKAVADLKQVSQERDDYKEAAMQAEVSNRQLESKLKDCLKENKQLKLTRDEVEKKLRSQMDTVAAINRKYQDAVLSLEEMKSASDRAGDSDGARLTDLQSLCLRQQSQISALQQELQQSSSSKPNGRRKHHSRDDDDEYTASDVNELILLAKRLKAELSHEKRGRERDANEFATRTAHFEELLQKAQVEAEGRVTAALNARDEALRAASDLKAALQVEVEEKEKASTGANADRNAVQQQQEKQQQSELESMISALKNDIAARDDRYAKLVDHHNKVSSDDRARIDELRYALDASDAARRQLEAEVDEICAQNAEFQQHNAELRSILLQEKQKQQEEQQQQRRLHPHRQQQQGSDDDEDQHDDAYDNSDDNYDDDVNDVVVEQLQQEVQSLTVTNRALTEALTRREEDLLHFKEQLQLLAGTTSQNNSNISGSGGSSSRHRRHHHAGNRSTTTPPSTSSSRRRRRSRSRSSDEKRGYNSNNHFNNDDSDISPSSHGQLFGLTQLDAYEESTPVHQPQQQHSRRTAPTKSRENEAQLVTRQQQHVPSQAQAQTQQAQQTVTPITDKFRMELLQQHDDATMHASGSGSRSRKPPIHSSDDDVHLDNRGVVDDHNDNDKGNNNDDSDSGDEGGSTGGSGAVPAMARTFTVTRTPTLTYLPDNATTQLPTPALAQQQQHPPQHPHSIPVAHSMTMPVLPAASPPRPAFHHDLSHHHPAANTNVGRVQTMPASITALLCSSLDAADELPATHDAGLSAFSPRTNANDVTNDEVQDETQQQKQQNELEDNQAEVQQSESQADAEVDAEAEAEAPGSLGDRYDFENEIGKGTFGIVYRAVRRHPSPATAAVSAGAGVVDPADTVAIKVVYRERLGNAQEDLIRKETQILFLLNRHGGHNNVIKCFDFYEDTSAFFIVQELMQGGELFDRLVKRQFYSEKEARDLVKAILSAVKHCHDHSVVHRDLKPENLLLVTPDDDSQLKLIDFGVSEVVAGDAPTLTGTVGSMGYMAPELFNDVPHGKPVDMWAVGAIMYILLSGSLPFNQVENPLKHIKLLKKGKINFPDISFGRVSEQAKSLIVDLLNKDAAARCTVDQALRHNWFKLESGPLSSHKLERSITQLRLFNARRKFKAVMRMVLAKARFERGLRSARHITSPAAHEIDTTTLREKYTIGEQIGQGRFGKLHRGFTTNATSSTSSASSSTPSNENDVIITIVDRNRLTAHALASIHHECLLLSQLPRHINIVPCLDFFESDSACFIVRDAVGPPLMDWLATPSLYRGTFTTYTELQARNIIRTLLTAVSHCHACSIAHRNVSPFALVLSATAPSDAVLDSLRLTDFNEAIHLLDHTNNGSSSRDEAEGGYCGTLGFAAPECITARDAHGLEVDMWSVGAACCLLLFGVPPFGWSLREQRLRLSSAGGVGALPIGKRSTSNAVSTQATDFLNRLLVVAPADRLKVDEALAHPWMSRSAEQLEQNNLNQAHARFRVMRSRYLFAKLSRAFIKKSKLVRLTKIAVCREHIPTLMTSATADMSLLHPQSPSVRKVATWPGGGK